MIEPRQQIKLRLRGQNGGVVEVIPSLVVAGLDFGFSDPLAIEVGAKIGSLWVNFYEVYKTRLGIGEVLKECVRVTRMFNLERIWADSEDPKMIEYLQSHNVPVLPNQIKSLDYGIHTLYGLMKQTVTHPVLGTGPRWRVDKAACPNLVREMGLYANVVVRGEVRTGKPADRHNHALDTVRYYVTGEGELPPELYTPEQKQRHHGVYVERGVWYDDPVGSQLAAARRHNQEEIAPWWDEKMQNDLDLDEIIGIDYEFD